jgi:hypothetical protein
MRTDTVTYYNGKRFMRRVRSVDRLFGTFKPRTYITFAYRGVANEWPTIISYTIR